jgi:glycosyltransferase involved in cell wall biosynthesis
VARKAPRKSGTKPLPRISVVIPVLNGEVPLRKCLDSLKSQDYPWKLIDLIVVDDDSSDGTVKLSKSYGARIVKNGQRHIERGKALGLRAAKNELVLFLDADNYFVSPHWLPSAVAAIQSDALVVGVESARFHYQATDPAANRYCSLMGINDPMAFYLGKRDRLTAWEDHWTLLGKLVGEEAGFWKLEFSRDAVPTVGSQGYLTRKSLLNKASHWPYLFHMDANVELIAQGHNRYVLLKEAVGHDHCKDASAFLKKCRRNLDLFFKWRHLRKYTWETPRGEFILTVLSMVTLARPLVDALRGFASKPDAAWFLHPVMSFAVPVMYTLQTLAHSLKGSPTHES